jgi:ATP-binding cassette subfamily C protein CydC
MMPLAVLALLEPLGVLPAAGVQLARARASAERLSYGTGTIDEPDAADNTNNGTGTTRATDANERTEVLADPPAVDFHAVTLIRGAGARVLEDLSLTISAAETVGIIGMSGCGKSSIAALLTGQIGADSGAIRLDGTHIEAFAVDSLYEEIAYLTQQTDLFSGTFAGNLRIANRDADEASMWSALRRVQLDTFVQSTEQGLHTWVGESGMSLSAGQARRLALARLFMRDPKLVILDEPLTGLDEPTADAVCLALGEWLEGRTALVLGHGDEALPGTDRQLILRAGRLSEHHG